MAQFLRASLISRLPFARHNIRLMTSSVQPTPAGTPKPADNGAHALKNNHRVNDLERKFLVWTKKYPSVDQVPDMVPQDVMERARNRIRIRLANIMMAVTAVACLVAIMSGKKASESGNTIQKQNLEWHNEYNKKAKEEYEKQVAAAAK